MARIKDYGGAPPVGATKKGKRERGRNKPIKPSSALTGALIVLIFFILLFGVATCLYVFDLFGTRGFVIDFLDVADEAVERDREKLVTWQTELSNTSNQLKEDQKKVNQQEEEIAQREAAVKEIEEDLEKKIALYDEMAAQLQPKNTDITTMAKAIERMSADTAGALLMAMSDKDARLYLFSMLKPSAKAAILETLDARTAAALVEGLS